MSTHKPPITKNPNALIDETAAARFLAVSPRTLRNWRTAGRGPRFVKVSGRCIRYSIKELMEWAERRTRRSTSDLGIFR